MDGELFGELRVLQLNAEALAELRRRRTSSAGRELRLRPHRER